MLAEIEASNTFLQAIVAWLYTGLTADWAEGGRREAG